MRPSTRRALETLRAAGFDAAALAALFADIRAAGDEALLADAPAPKAKTPADPLIGEVTALLAPILGRSSEKAALLVAHLSALTGQTLPTPSGGLPAAVRALRKHLSDEDIRDGAFGLRAHLARERSTAERVK